MNTTCARELDVLDAVVSGRWPAAVDEQLRQHAAVCESCAEVVLVAGALRSDAVALSEAAPVPSAAHVWWRASLRARFDGAQDAARPITWAQGLAAAAAIGLLVALIGVTWPTVFGAVRWLAGMATANQAAGAQMGALLGGVIVRSLPVIIAAAVCLVIAPVAVYFALSDE